MKKKGKKMLTKWIKRSIIKARECILNLFRRKSNKKHKRAVMNPPNNGFQIPEVPRSYVYHPEVIIFSKLLKDEGVNQKLRYGDWYCVLDKETNRYLCKIYSRTPDSPSFGSEDFDLVAVGDYFRVILEDEAMNLLRYLNYDFDPERGGIQSFGEDVEVSFVNRIYGTNIVCVGDNPHAALLKAVHMALTHTKSFQNGSSTMLHSTLPPMENPPPPPEIDENDIEVEDE